MVDEATARNMAFGDVERELKVTRRVLERLPMDKFDWKPHEKSMSLGSLAIHVANIPDWARSALDSDVLDFEKIAFPPKRMADTAGLLAYFDKMAGGLRAAIERFDITRWNGTWTMQQGAKVFTTAPRATAFRIWALNHLVNHRAQLCVYLRLLNLPVPAVYFNSADEPDWKFE